MLIYAYKCLFTVRQLIDGLGGLSFNVSEPYPDFDLTERLIQLMEYKVFPLFQYKIDFHHYQSRTLVLQITSPEEPLLFARNSSQAVSLLQSCVFFKQQ